MLGHRTVAKGHLKDLLNRDRKTKKKIKADKEKVLERMRAGFSAFRYMDQSETKTKFNKIVKDVWEQFKFAEAVYNKKHPDAKVQLADLWIEWLTAYYAKVEEVFVKNAKDMITEVRFHMDGLKDYLAREVLTTVRNFEKEADDAAKIHIDTSGFPKMGDVDMGGT